MTDLLSIRTIYIKKRTISQWLTCYILVFPFLLAFLLEFLHLPSLLKYSIDLAWVSVFVIIFFRSRVYLRKQVALYAALIGIWFLYTLITYLFNYQSPFYYLWGLRNNFRFYVAFLAFAMLFDEDDAEYFLRFMDGLFWVNAVVTFVQFFFLGYEQDYLGGIFGVERGCNAYSIIFFSVIVGKSMLSFMNGQENPISCFLKCGVSLFFSALAEVKVFFVIFVVIGIVAAFFTKFSFRKFALFLAAAILFMYASSVLTTVFGENSSVSLESVWKSLTVTHYATAEDLGRMTAIPIISNSVLTDIPDKLFGMGLGNCDTSSFAICNTPFYKSHADWHYTWLSSAFLFLETGYVGLVMYVSFYIICFVTARKKRKNGDGNLLFCQISMIMSVVCVILTFYNSSLRMEVGYIAYFALALPFVNKRGTA